MRPVSERAAAVDGFLSQLASGLSAYRLFPGDLSQPGFLAAAERVRDAVQMCLGAGVADIEVRSGHFVGPEGVELRHDQHDRLARECYERQVEHLHIYDVPRDDELAALYDVLSRPLEEVLEAGGPSLLLNTLGVTSLLFERVTVEAGDSLSRLLDELDPEQLQVWKEVTDHERLAGNLSLLAAGASADSAQGIFRRIRTMAALLPDRMAESPEFFNGVRGAIDLLPKTVRHEFTAVAISSASMDNVAAGYLSSMNDRDLAQLLVEFSEDGGPDPVALAQRVEQLTRTQGGLSELTANLMASSAEILDVVRDQARPTIVALSATSDESALRTTVSDLLASRLLSQDHADMASIRKEYPETIEEFRALSTLALTDYLIAEDEMERLDLVLEAWGAAVAEALRDNDREHVYGLLDVGERVFISSAGSQTKRDHLESARDGILTLPLMVELTRQMEDETAAARVLDLLRPFGPAGTAAVLNALAFEEVRGKRAMLISATVDLAEKDVRPVIARLSDPRWYVVRNAITILSRLRSEVAFEAFTKLMNHPEAAVRRDLVRGLIAVGGNRGVSLVTQLADDKDQSVRHAAVGALGGLANSTAATALSDVVKFGRFPEQRIEAVEALGSHPSTNAAELLKELGSRRLRPKLPRAVRRAVKAASKTGKS